MVSRIRTLFSLDRKVLRFWLRLRLRLRRWWNQPLISNSNIPPKSDRQRLETRQGRVIYGGNIESTFLSCYVVKLSCASQILYVIAPLFLVYTQTENSRRSLCKFWNTRSNFFFNLSARVVSNLSIFLAVVCESLLALILWVLKTHIKVAHNKCKLLPPTMNVPAETLISQNGKSEPLFYNLARETEQKKGSELYIPCAKLAPSILFKENM